MIIASLIVDYDTDSDAVKIGDKIQAYWTSDLLKFEGLKRIMFTVCNVDRYIGRRSGRHAIDTRSPLGRQSTETRSTVDRLSIAISSECRTI